jgi:hypothetical protein
MWFIKSNVLKLALALGSFFVGLEELLEAYFINLKGVFELYHAVIFISFIHMMHAVEGFIEVRKKWR